jgi:protein-L-isoaspartate O-methyltransferase
VAPGGPIALDRVETIAALRSAIDTLGYTGEAVRDRLGDDAYQAGRRDLPVLVRRLGAGDPLETVIRVFFLAAPVSRGELERALAPVTVAELERLGVATATGDHAYATVRLVPHTELLLAGNLHPGDGPDGTPEDYVATVTAPSATLASLTVRRPVRTALDIGTGSGVQALWAARHCERVVAVDVNPRALNLAAFNARLNGIDNIELREGSVFEPVAGERFDLIVCNAPYVVSPDERYAFRDSGVAADGFCERLVREAAAHLEEGGFAHLLVGWILRGGEWEARPKSWVEGSGCDAWVLLGVSRDPVTHAALWNEDLRYDPVSHGETLDRWIGYLETLGADGVGEGAVIMRRRSRGDNWFRADRIRAGGPSPASNHVLRVFDAHDHLAGLEAEAALLDEVLALAEGVRIEQELSCRDGGYVVESMTMVLDEGLGFRAGVDQNTASLLPLLNGKLSLRDAIVAAAESRGLGESDREAFTAGALGVARSMYELGFLTRRNQYNSLQPHS